MSDGTLIELQGATAALELLKTGRLPHEFEEGSLGAVACEGLDDTWEEAVDACLKMLDVIDAFPLDEVRQVVTDICMWQQRVIPEAPAIVGPASLELLAMKLLHLRSLLGMNSQ